MEWPLSWSWTAAFVTPQYGVSPMLMLGICASHVPPSPAHVLRRSLLVCYCAWLFVACFRLQAVAQVRGWSSRQRSRLKEDFTYYVLALSLTSLSLSRSHSLARSLARSLALSLSLSRAQAPAPGLSGKPSLKREIESKVVSETQDSQVIFRRAPRRDQAPAASRSARSQEAAAWAECYSL